MFACNPYIVLMNIMNIIVAVMFYDIKSVLPGCFRYTASNVCMLVTEICCISTHTKVIEHIT